MTQPIVQVDAFTARPFAGNPAAVCLLERPRDEEWLRNVAREMNLSETAFLLPAGGGRPGDFHLRWFTPATEVDLCGHATLAAAHVLWEEGRIAPGAEIRFQTRSGLLTARREDDGWITLDFPAKPPSPAPPAIGLLESLRLGEAQVLYTGRNDFDYLVEVDSEEAVKNLRPDLGLLGTVEARGVIVTAAAGGVGTATSTGAVGAAATGRDLAAGYDFVSRFFAPRVGVPEDPVTGSAHCCLGPYWGERLGRREMAGRQVSARGGLVRVHLAGDRVHLGGQAVTVLRGELLEG